MLVGSLLRRSREADGVVLTTHALDHALELATRALSCGWAGRADAAGDGGAARSWRGDRRRTRHGGAEPCGGMGDGLEGPGGRARAREFLGAMLAFALVTIVTLNFAFDLSWWRRGGGRRRGALDRVPVCRDAWTGRSLAVERDRGTLEGLTLCPVSRDDLPREVHLKCAFIVVVQIVALPVFAALYDLPSLRRRCCCRGIGRGRICRPGDALFGGRGQQPCARDPDAAVADSAVDPDCDRDGTGDDADLRGSNQ